MSNILESNADLNEKVVEIINMLKEKKDSRNNTMNLFSIRQINPDHANFITELNRHADHRPPHGFFQYARYPRLT